MGGHPVTTLTFRDGTHPNSPLWAEISEAEFKRQHGLDSGKYDFSDRGVYLLRGGNFNSTRPNPHLETNTLSQAA